MVLLERLPANGTVMITDCRKFGETFFTNQSTGFTAADTYRRIDPIENTSEKLSDVHTDHHTEAIKSEMNLEMAGPSSVTRTKMMIPTRIRISAYSISPAPSSLDERSFIGSF